MTLIYNFNTNKVSENPQIKTLPKEEAEVVLNEQGKYEFKDPLLSRFETMLSDEILHQRKKEAGVSYAEENGTNGKVLIIRAVHYRTNTFKPMDYVMVYDGVIPPSVYAKMKDYLDEGEPLITAQQKKVGWVASHAQTMAVSYSEQHHVIVARVDAKDVRKATNEGEYFYDGEIKTGKVVFGVHEFGYFMSEKEMKQEDSLTL